MVRYEVELCELVYPVGSIYMSVNNTNPSLLFGGEWVQIKDTFLLACGTNHNNGETGGSETVSLTKSQMPRHTHIQNSHNHNMAHTHRHRHDVGSVWSDGTGSTGAYTQTSNRHTFTRYTGYDETASSKTNTNDATATNKYTGGTGTSESESNGSAHNNMPPYLAVYVWRRKS